MLLLYFDKLNSVRPFLLQLRLNAAVLPVRTVCLRRSKLKTFLFSEGSGFKGIIKRVREPEQFKSLAPGTLLKEAESKPHGAAAPGPPGGLHDLGLGSRRIPGYPKGGRCPLYLLTPVPRPARPPGLGPAPPVCSSYRRPGASPAAVTQRPPGSGPPADPGGSARRAENPRRLEASPSPCPKAEKKNLLWLQVSLHKCETVPERRVQVSTRGEEAEKVSGGSVTGQFGRFHRPAAPC